MEGESTSPMNSTISSRSREFRDKSHANIRRNKMVLQSAKTSILLKLQEH